MESLSKNKDIYYTIENKSKAEIKVKNSRFIASAAHVTSRDEAIAVLDSVRAEFHDAKHHCYAYRLGENGMEFRFSDGGEPSGSAGKPILFQIKKFDVTDVIIVVTRYFGGTKLGVGGLARAYSDAAEKVLETVERKQVIATKVVKVFCIYEDLPILKRLLETYAVSYEENYQDSIEFSAEIPKTEIEIFIELLMTKTKGRAGYQLT